MKNSILILGLLFAFSACEKVDEILDDCAACNDQIDNYIQEYNSTNCFNNTTELSNECSTYESAQAAGIAKETCLEGTVQHPGDCENLGRINTPFILSVDVDTPDSLKFELENNGHEIVNGIGHESDIQVIFKPKIHAGIPVLIRLLKVPGDSILANYAPTMSYDRTEDNESVARRVIFTYNPDTGYGISLEDWD